MAKKVQDLTENSMQNLKLLADSSSVIGEPVITPDGTTILPVSKVSFGFGSGGGDLPSSQKELFGGGTGAGVSLTPVGFLVVTGGDTKFIPVQTFTTTADRMVGMVPDVIDKVNTIITEKSAKKKADNSNSSQDSDDGCNTTDKSE